jgi:N6-L-threonylcarbamoyladenine synthase
VQLHSKHRGVVPEIASRSHTTRILPVIQAALSDANVAMPELAAVAVTNQPGMVGCLLVGTSAAKALSWLHQLPLVGVDHIQAHIHAGFMTDPSMEQELPGLALVASGGHTALYLVHGPGNTERIGATRDDAAGEALDKGAAMLGLPYPGGPSIQEAARRGRPDAVNLPRPLKDKGLDFSFSGIKTALLYHLRGNGVVLPMPDLSDAEVSDLAASYQWAVVDCLVTKLRRAAKTHGTRSLSIGGGVACNELLRQRIQSDDMLGSLHLVFPPMELCSDNAAMVAGLGTLLLAREQIDDLHLAVNATSRRSR